MNPDIVVVGAGAAGLMAASEAAHRGRRVVLLEKNRKAGLKILISGGGRCNLTTTRRGADLENQYGPRRGRWLRHALRSFTPAHLCTLIESLGVALQEEDLEKIFPVSGRAGDIVEALRRHAVDRGVHLVFEAAMSAVESMPTGFRVDAGAAGTFDASSLVLATGGLSYPKTGTTGDGYAVAKQFGHQLVPTVPHLAPLSLEVDWVNALQGLVVDAELTVRDADGRALVVRRRPLLFTHLGLSGPAAMDVSGFIEESPRPCELVIDFSPDCSADELDAALIAGARTQGRRLVAHLLPEHLPDRLRRALATTAGVGETPAASLSRSGRRALVHAVKSLRLPIERSLGFKAAEVTRGGVPLDEVDARSMQSKRRNGLFFCGEILDVDGPIGGFNFQAAFATGRLAGLHA